MSELRLVMEIAAQKRLNDILRYQLEATTAMLQRILDLSSKRSPELHAEIVALFEQEIQERENVDANDAADALGAYAAQGGITGAQGCHQPSGDRG